MSDRDEHDEWAAQRLPCTARCTVAAYPYSGVVSHSMDCPYHYRPAVAADRREQAKQLGPYWICEEHPELEFPHDDCPGPGMPSSNRARIIVDLKAEVERLKRGYQLSQFSSRACPGCEYKEGVFIKFCVLHQEQDDLRTKLAEAEAEVARLKSDAALWREFQLHDSAADAIERIVQLKDEIADLRAKLAESEAEANGLVEIGLRQAARADLAEIRLAEAEREGEAWKERCIAERANNIRLQIRAEDCGRPAHNFPDGQSKIDRSVNEEVLARRQIESLIDKAGKHTK